FGDLSERGRGMEDVVGLRKVAEVRAVAEVARDGHDAGGMQAIGIARRGEPAQAVDRVAPVLSRQLTRDGKPDPPGRARDQDCAVTNAVVRRWKRQVPSWPR